MRTSAKAIITATIATALVAGGISWICFYFFDVEKGGRLVNEAYEAELRGEYDSALSKIDNALQHRLTRNVRAIAYHNRGGMCNWKWRYDDAIHDYTEAVRLDSKFVNAYIGRSFAYSRRGQRDKAIKDLDAAIQLDPNSYAAHYGRGMLFVQGNEPDRGLADFEEAIRCDPNSADAFVMRGVCYAAKDDLDHALANFEAAIFLDPKNAMAYMQRSRVYFRKGEQEKARNDRHQADRLDPNVVKTSNDLISPLIPKGPESPVTTIWYKYDIGRDYYGAFRDAIQASAAGDHDRAIDLYNLILQMQVTAAQASTASMNRGNAYRDKQEWDKALRDYNDAIRLNSKNAGAYVNRGSALWRAGEKESAIKDYDEAIRINPDQWEAYFNRACSLREDGRLEEAIKDLEFVIKLNPGFVGIYINRAAVYFEKGEVDKAFSDYNRAIEIDPNSAEAHAGRANVYIGKKKYAEAAGDLERVAQLNPTQLDVALNSVAWFHATCPEPRVRNGQRAIDEATKACELTQWKNWRYIDTLAAAHAEAGNFEQAIEYQKQAMSMAQGEPDLAKEIRQRLNLFEQHKPYRESVNR